MPGHALALMYNNIIVGFISAHVIDFISKINSELVISQIGCVNYLCIQKNLRNCGLSKLLIDKLIHNLSSDGITRHIYYTHDDSFNVLHNNTFLTSNIYSREYAIPINIPKLKSINFITDHELPIIRNNPLHLFKKNNVEQVLYNLNTIGKFIDDGDIYRIFDKNDILFLLPIKNVIYSFVVLDDKNIVTDFVSVRVNIDECVKTGVCLNVGYLSWYYHTSMSMSQLILFLVDKLQYYEVDHLLFHETNNNLNIDIDKYLISSISYNVNCVMENGVNPSNVKLCIL